MLKIQQGKDGGHSFPTLGDSTLTLLIELTKTAMGEGSGRLLQKLNTKDILGVSTPVVRVACALTKFPALRNEREQQLQLIPIWSFHVRSCIYGSLFSSLDPLTNSQMHPTAFSRSRLHPP